MGIARDPTKNYHPQHNGKICANASLLEELSSRSPPRKGELAVRSAMGDARFESGLQPRHWSFAVDCGHWSATHITKSAGGTETNYR